MIACQARNLSDSLGLDISTELMPSESGGGVGKRGPAPGLSSGMAVGLKKTSAPCPTSSSAPGAERHNLSRELHNSLAQDLSALKIYLDTLPEDLIAPTREAFGPRLSHLSRQFQGAGGRPGIGLGPQTPTPGPIVPRLVHEDVFRADGLRSISPLHLLYCLHDLRPHLPGRPR